MIHSAGGRWKGIGVEQEDGVRKKYALFLLIVNIESQNDVYDWVPYCSPCRTLCVSLLGETVTLAP
jgi:hypothetical protein